MKGGRHLPSPKIVGLRMGSKSEMLFFASFAGEGASKEAASSSHLPPENTLLCCTLDCSLGSAVTFRPVPLKPRSRPTFRFVSPTHGTSRFSSFLPPQSSSIINTTTCSSKARAHTPIALRRTPAARRQRPHVERRREAPRASHFVRKARPGVAAEYKSTGKRFHAREGERRGERTPFPTAVAEPSVEPKISDLA